MTGSVREFDRESQLYHRNRRARKTWRLRLQTLFTRPRPLSDNTLPGCRALLVDIRAPEVREAYRRMMARRVGVRS